MARVELQEVLITRLVGDSELATLTGSHIYPNTIPQNRDRTGDPLDGSIVLKRAGKDASYSHDGFSCRVKQRIQFVCQSKTYNTALQISRRLWCVLGTGFTANGLTVKPIFLRDEREDYIDRRDSSEFGTHRIIVTYQLHHAEDVPVT